MANKSSRIHVLCDDVICFRLAKKSHAICIGTAFSFLSNAIRVKNLFKENLKTLTTTKEATKKEQAWRSRWTRKRGSKPLKNLTGAANLQSKNSRFLATCETKLGGVLSYLENAISHIINTCTCMWCEHFYIYKCTCIPSKPMAGITSCQ